MTDEIEYPPSTSFQKILENPMSQNGKRLQSIPSISSSESGFGVEDTVDAIPQRMPLFCEGEDYIEHKKASMEDVISNRRPYGSLPRLKRPYYDGRYYDLEDCSFHPRTSFCAGDRKTNEGFINNGDREKSKIHPACSHNSNANAKSNAGNEKDNKEPPQQKFSVVETDLGPRRQPRWSLKDIKCESSSNGNCENEEISSATRSSSNVQEEPENQCCGSVGCLTCCAMFQCKYMFSRFSAWDLCLSLFSVGVYIFDIVTDLILVLWYYYYRDWDPAYLLFFRLTLAFVVGPSLIVQLFSYKWVIDDFRTKKEKERKRSDVQVDKICPTVRELFMLIFVAILHIFQLATLFRYVRVIIYGFKSRYYEVKKKNGHQQHFDKLWRDENNDVNLLRLLESFLESAPQLLLQFYIMLTKSVEIINVVSFVASLIGLSTSLVSIQRAIRNSNPKKNQLTICASIVMFIWRACTVSSRVIALSLFLTIQPFVLLLFVILHWVIAAALIAWKGTNFCTRKAAEYCFDIVVGFIYTFCFFNVHEEVDGQPSYARYRMLAFYTIIFAENSALSITWYHFRDNVVVFFHSDDLDAHNVTSTPMTKLSESDRIFPELEALLLVAMVHVSFFLGMVFMLLYYGLCHPKNNPSSCCCSKKEQDASNEAKDTSSVLYSDQKPIESLCMTGETERVQALQDPQEHRVNNGGDAGNNIPRKPSSHRSLSDFLTRRKRVEDRYTSQYSKEKHLENHSRTSQRTKTENQHAEAIPMQTYPEQEGGLQKTAGHHNQSGCSNFSTAAKSNKLVAKSSPTDPSSDRTADCVKRPADFGKDVSCSSKKTCTVNNSNSASRSSTRCYASLPKSSRGYSASMSCLIDDGFSPYSKERSVNQDFKAPSYVLNTNEVLECIETNL